MQGCAVLRFGVLFCLVCAIISVSAGEKGEKGGKGKWGKGMMEKMKKCGDGEINVEEAFKGKKECFADLKKKKDADSGSRRRRSPHEDGEGGGKKGKKGKGGWGGKMGKHMCGAVCQWKKVGVLDESGKYSESHAKEHIAKVYPEKFRTDIANKMKKCADDNSKDFSMDNNCAGYKGFKKCVVKAHMETCGISWGKGKGGGKKGGGKKESQGEDEAAGDEE